MESEGEKAENKHGHGDRTDGKKSVTPAPVVVSAATWLAWGSDEARVEVCSTAIVRNEAIRNGRTNDYADGLENTQKGQKPAMALSIVSTGIQGWNLADPKKQYTCGMNSSVIVVSMGIFPPTPKPTNAVSTRKVV